MASDSGTRPTTPGEPVKPTAPGAEPVKPTPQRIPAPEEPTGGSTVNWGSPVGAQAVIRSIVGLMPPKTAAPSWKDCTNAEIRSAATEGIDYAKEHTFAEFRDHLIANGVRPECISEDEYDSFRAGTSALQRDLKLGPGMDLSGYARAADGAYARACTPSPNRYSARQFEGAGLTDLVPSYTEAVSQQKYLETVTARAAEADRQATAAYEEAMAQYRKDVAAYDTDLAAYQKWLRDNDLWVKRGQYEFCEPGDTTDALIEPAEAPPAGTTRLVDPAPEAARVAWSRLGGSNTLDGWRADAQLVVDITPVPNSTNVTITARVRGIGVRRADDGVWRRTAPYRAAGALNLLARDINGSFGVISRAKAEDHVFATGTDPVTAATLTHTVPRNALLDYAIDWAFRADEQDTPDGSITLRATAGGRKVLFVPPSLDGYRPGKISDPATGDRSGQAPSAATPLQHRVNGHATVTTAAAKTAGRTVVSAEVYADVRTLANLLPELGTTVDLDIVSALDRYDVAADSWKSVASGSTRATKKAVSASVTSGTFTTEVPTGELNLYRYTWRAGDTYQGGSYVGGTIFPIYTTGK